MLNAPETKKEITAVECRFAFHIPTKSADIPDVHLIKEQITRADGTKTPNLRFVENFKRSFYLTSPNKRNYKQKKEYERLDNLLEYQCTQSQLRDHVARALGITWSKEPLKSLSNSPYLYGSDISSTSIIKKKYRDRFPGYTTPYSICTFDIETDVVRGTEDPIIISAVFNNHVYIVVDKIMVKGIVDPEGLFNERLNKYLGKVIERRQCVDGHNFQCTFKLADGPVDMIRMVFDQIHKWQPDWLAIWNMDFDIPKVLNCLKKYDVDPKSILCDPRVPEIYRVCDYKPGATMKVTASGKQMPINPAARWHTLHLTASFYVIDQMCTFKHLRNQEQERSMKLNDVLFDFLGERKLSFKEADAYEELRWHQFMQVYYVLEYCVYNVWDSLSLIELDAKLNDLAVTLPDYAEISDFEMFRSQPKRIVDALHYFFLEKKGIIISSTGRVKKADAGYVPPNVEDYGEGWLDDSDVDNDDEDDDDEVPDFDKEVTTLNLRGWIVTLRADLQVPGIRCIAEDPTLATSIFPHTYDSDATAAYPTATSIANVSRSTTKRELISMDGVTEEVFRVQNLNLVLGITNSVQYTVTMFNMPKPVDLLSQFKEDMCIH